MMYASTKDLRFHTKELMDVAKSGEDVIITYRGKPCVRLSVLDEETEIKTKEHTVFGMWSDDKRTENPVEYIRDLRKGRF